MKRRAHRFQFAYGALTVLLAICMLFLGVIIGSKKVAQVEADSYVEDREKYYTSIIVESGDTLWDIADEYISAEYEDKAEFIEEVCEMNHITGGKIIDGETILIPYYSDSASVMAINQ